MALCDPYIAKNIISSFTAMQEGCFLGNEPGDRTGLQMGEPSQQSQQSHSQQCQGSSNTDPQHTMDADMTQVGCFSVNVLSQNYYQCRSGRDATFKDDAIECCNGPQLGYIVGGELPRLGSFETDLKSTENCFMGSRIFRENLIVNQNMSSTFDPATLTCLTCENTHAVLHESPVCFCVSDQNFVGNLSGGAGSKGCVGVVRLESAGLIELTDIILEIFKTGRLYPGSVICLGSATHLHRVGATSYASDWNICVARLNKTFQNVQVCPLVPIPSTDCPGALAQEISYLACWFARMYAGSTQGLPDCWAKLTRMTAALTTSDQPATAYATVSMPVSLSPDAPLTTIRFRSNQVRHVSTSGLDVKATEELVLALLTSLQKTLGIDCTPGDTPVRIPANEQRRKENIGKLIVIGASNMRRCIPALQQLGYEVLDLTNLDWNGSDEAVARVVSAIDELAQDPATLCGSAFVLDLFSGISYRFAQADGGLALPMKVGGRFHLLGNLDVCADAGLKKSVSRFFDLLRKIDSKEIPMVVLPPLPRYLAGGCCPNTTHAPNAADGAHSESFLQKIMHMRSEIRKALTGSGLRNLWVPDPVHGMTGRTGERVGGGATAGMSVPDMAAELIMLMLGDNVHFTPLGYTRLAGEIDAGVKLAVKKQVSAAVIFSGPGSSDFTGTERGASKTFFWRGFISRHGAARPKATGNYKSGSGSSSKSAAHPHPYRGRGRKR